MKLVVYGPQKRLGAVEGDNVIDLNLACASYLASQGHPLPFATADASVPSELGAFIEAEQRGIETAQRAIDAPRAATTRASSSPLSKAKLHAPYARRCRIMMAGGNYHVHSQGMSSRGQTLEEVYNAARGAASGASTASRRTPPAPASRSSTPRAPTASTTRARSP